MNIDADYVIDNPVSLHLSTGETVQAVRGTGLSEDEVHSWGEAAVRHMIGSGTMHRVSAHVDVRELVAAGAGMGVVERDGVSDVAVPFGPEGERLDGAKTHPGTGVEMTAIEVPLGETGVLSQEGDPRAVEVTQTDFPQPLGDNKFKLSDGRTVVGRSKAVKAQAALEG